MSTSLCHQGWTVLEPVGGWTADVAALLKQTPQLQFYKGLLSG